MINQVFHSVEKSERAIKKTKQSIAETVKFLKELEEKEKYSSERKYASKS